MLPNTQLANELAKASVFWYYFFSRFEILIIAMMAKLIIGVTIIIKVVNCQLITYKKTKLPKNWIKFLSRIEILSDAAPSTVLTSLVSLDISSPVLFLSQQDISFFTSLQKSQIRISLTIFSPSKLKLQPLIAEKTAIMRVNARNFNASFLSDYQFLMWSMMVPHNIGKIIMPPEETSIAKLAEKIMHL